MLTNFKDEDFDNKIKNEDISVIQFSAAWCGPCKALKPVMDKLSDEYKDKAGFYYADIEDGGIVTIASHDGAAAEEAQKIIEGLTRKVHEGEIFSGVVTRIIPIGAFVEILPGKEGMVHISQLSEARVERVEDEQTKKHPELIDLYANQGYIQIIGEDDDRPYSKPKKRIIKKKKKSKK